MTTPDLGQSETSALTWASRRIEELEKVEAAARRVLEVSARVGFDPRGPFGLAIAALHEAFGEPPSWGQSDS